MYENRKKIFFIGLLHLEILSWDQKLWRNPKFQGYWFLFSGSTKYIMAHYLMYTLHILTLLILKIKFCMIYFEALVRMEAWWRWAIHTDVTCLQWTSFLDRFFLRVTNSTSFMLPWSSSRGQRNLCWKMSSSKSFNIALQVCIIHCSRYRWC